MGQAVYFKDANHMYHVITQYKEVILYGTGAVGRTIYQCFQEQEEALESRVLCFAVTRTGSLDAAILGKKIVEIGQLTSYKKDACVLVATRPEYHEEILQTLHTLEFENVFVLDTAILRKDLEAILKRQNDIFNQPDFQDTLNRLALSDLDFALFASRILCRKTLKFEVSLVEHCNLNCQCCDHFSPLAEEEFLNLDVFERDFRRLAELFGSDVVQIDLLGGEPLLHPELNRFLESARRNFKYANISIVTNGILLDKMPEEFWVACREYAIEIVATQYPISINYEGLRALSEKKGVLFSIFYDSSMEKTTYHLPLNLKGDSDGYENYIKCFRSNSCIFLKHSRLYGCTVAPNVVHFSRYFNKELPSTEADGIDIFQVSSKEEIYAFLAKPLGFCCYCDAGREKKGLPWAISKRRMEEWT